MNDDKPVQYGTAWKQTLHLLDFTPSRKEATHHSRTWRNRFWLAAISGLVNVGFVIRFTRKGNLVKTE